MLVGTVASFRGVAALQGQHQKAVVINQLKRSASHQDIALLQIAVRDPSGFEVANEIHPFCPQCREHPGKAELLLDMTVQQVALRPLHFDDREPLGADLDALLEKPKINVVAQADLVKMSGNRLIPFGMVADGTQEAANRPGLPE